MRNPSNKSQITAKLKSSPQLKPLQQDSRMVYDDAMPRSGSSPSTPSYEVTPRRPVTEAKRPFSRTNASVLLDLLRGLASLIVVLGHGRNFLFVDYHQLLAHPI